MWTTARQASLSITNSQSPLKPVPIELVMTSSHLILCRPLLFLPSVFPMNIQDWFPLGWTGLISYSKGTLRSFLQHHSSKASILRCSAFFTVQLSHPYMITGKTIALTRWTLVGKVMSLFLNMLSRLVITFLPRSKCLLISWLQSTSVVILESKKIKSVTVSVVSPSICREMMGLNAVMLVFWMLSFKPAFSLSSFTFITRPTTGHTHRGNQNWKRHVYPSVHRSTVYNSQDMEAT